MSEGYRAANIRSHLIAFGKPHTVVSQSAAPKKKSGGGATFLRIGSRGISHVAEPVLMLPFLKDPARYIGLSSLFADSRRLRALNTMLLRPDDDSVEGPQDAEPDFKPSFCTGRVWPQHDEEAAATALWVLPRTYRRDFEHWPPQSASLSSWAGSECRAYYNGIVSFAASRHMSPLDQTVLRVLQGMVATFFPCDTDACDSSDSESRSADTASVSVSSLLKPRRFYNEPPVGYGLVAFGPLAEIVAVEWVGHIFVSTASAPFPIGSSAHKAAVAALRSPAYSWPEMIDEDPTGWLAAAAGPLADKVSWRVYEPFCAGEPDPGRRRFQKLVRYDAHAAERFVHMARVYRRLRDLHAARVHATRARHDTAATGTATPPAGASAGASAAASAGASACAPAGAAARMGMREAAATLVPSASVVLDCRLLYGEHEVMVEMEAVPGEPCSDADLDTDEVVVQAVAAAIAWLASQGIIYTDIRGPNVLVQRDRYGSVVPGSVKLIDYDDCVFVGEPILSMDAFMAALRKHIDECSPAELRRDRGRTWAADGAAALLASASGSGRGGMLRRLAGELPFAFAALACQMLSVCLTGTC